MEVTNLALLQRTLECGGSGAKFVLGPNAIVFFPATQQHRDIKQHGLSYEDDYKGNALAGVVTRAKVEIRFHAQYSDALVRTLWSQFLATLESAELPFGKVYYQGREIA